MANSTGPMMGMMLIGGVCLCCVFSCIGILALYYMNASFKQSVDNLLGRTAATTEPFEDGVTVSIVNASDTTKGINCGKVFKGSWEKLRKTGNGTYSIQFIGDHSPFCHNKYLKYAADSPTLLRFEADVGSDGRGAWTFVPLGADTYNIVNSNFTTKPYLSVQEGNKDIAGLWSDANSAREQWIIKKVA